MGDISCRAICVCLSDYSGENCDVSRVILIKKQRIRSQLLDRLAVIVSNSNPTPESISSLSAGLSAITQNPIELNDGFLVGSEEKRDRSQKPIVRRKEGKLEKVSS